MTGLGRIPRIGQVLAAWALLGLAGCQQTGPHPGGPATLGSGGDPNAGKTITPAQEADVQISMGRVAEKEGDVEQAMAAYRAALSRDHHRADAHLRLAVLHDKQAKFRESAELYQKALALRPGDAEIYCDMGYSLYLQRRWAEAEMNLRQAIALKADLARAHNNLAMVLARDTRVDAALMEFQKGGSDTATAHANVAFVLTTENRCDEARKQYELALAADPSSKEFKDRLDQLKGLVARLDHRRDEGAVTRDEHLVATSANLVRPPIEPAAAVAGKALSPLVTATEPSISRPRAPYPFDLTPREIADRNTETIKPGNIQPGSPTDESRTLPASEISDRTSGQTRSRIPPPRKVGDAPSTLSATIDLPESK